MWEQTDEFQFVKRISENRFEVLETVLVGEGYELWHIDIDLNIYNEDDLEKEVRGYYSSFSEVKEIYKDDWKQIVAEIIAENDASSSSGGEYLKNVEELKKRLQEEYEIELQ